MSEKLWRITFPSSIAGLGTTIEVDGQEITNQLRISRVEVYADVGEPVDVVLHCIPDKLEVSGVASEDNPIRTQPTPPALYYFCKHLP